MSFKYKIKPVALNVENIDTLDFPKLEERTIEKRGDVWTFTINDMVVNKEKGDKIRLEKQGALDHAVMFMKNIEEYHPEVLELSDEKLNAYTIYYAKKTEQKKCEEEIKEIDEYLAAELKDMEDIVKQIPELKEVKEKLYDKTK